MKISKKEKNYLDHLDFKHALGGVYYRNDFKDIRTMVLTIGFNRSGSSLMGFLLTAHPNMVIADEIHQPDTKGKIRRTPIDEVFGIGEVYLYKKYNGALNNLFYTILDIDRFRYQSKILSSPLQTTQRSTTKEFDFSIKPRRDKRYILVPNQYQGRFKGLKVIGVKSSRQNTTALLTNNTLVNLKRKLKERDIKLKFLFTVRNPYDIAGGMRKKFKPVHEEKFCRIFKNCCEQQEKILKRINPQDIFVCRHEDMCKDPRRQLARICDFLQVPVAADYIEDCVSQVAQEPRRHRANWLPKLKQTVALLNERYDFFSNYNWET